MLVNEQFYYEERLDDKIDAKRMLYGPLESFNKKHASAYLGYERDGESLKKLAKKHDYTEDSIKVTISNTKGRLKSFLENSDEYQLIKYLCEI